MSPATIWGCVVLILTGFAIFSPAIGGSWLWDDGVYIQNNRLVHSVDGYSRVWVTLNPLGNDKAGNYYPLSTLANWLEWHLWGDWTPGYHLVSIALHIVSALLVWRLFARLGLALAWAWVGAMLFLVHPLMVESVAWMSELKNTLSLPLFLMAMLSWLDYDEKKSGEAYRASLLWFALSLAAKTSGLMLPVVLLLHAVWKRRRLTLHDAKILSPFFALSLVAGILMLLPPQLSRAPLIMQSSWSLGSALASVGWTILFLLGKAFVPAGLLPDYPGFEIRNPSALDFLPWIILGVLVLLIGVGWRRATRISAITLGLGFFLLNLIPVVVFVAKNYDLMYWSLDHLTYLPMIGLIGGVVACLGRVSERIEAPKRRFLWGGIGALLLLFAWGSFSYAKVFSGPDRFWLYMLDREPGNWRVHDNYGQTLEADLRFPEAVEQFRKAAELNPGSDLPQFDLAVALATAGDAAEARDHYLQAAKLNPHEMRAYLALADIARKAGDLSATDRYIDQALAAVPGDAAPLVARAALRMQQGRKSEALDLYSQAVKKNPNALEYRYNYGVALLQSGMLPQAVEQLRAAVALDESFAPAHQNLGVALAQSGAVPDAAQQFEAVVNLEPDNANARDNLGLALAQTGRLEDAIEQFKKALEINPNDANAKKSLDKLNRLQLGTPDSSHP